MHKDLSEDDWHEAEQIAQMKVWNNDWQDEEVQEPDPSLTAAIPDFVASDGHGRTVMVVVRVIRHPVPEPPKQH